MPETDLACLSRSPDATAAPPGAEGQTARRRRWTVEQGAVLAEIAASPDLPDDTRRAWCAALAGVALTDEGEAALTALLDAVRVRAVSAALTGTPGAWRRLSALVARLSGLRETHPAAR